MAGLLGRTVSELEATISEDEIAEWAAFYLLEPWGYAIENFRSAMGPYIATSIAAKKGSRHKLSDFMRRPPVRRSPALAEVCGALGVRYDRPGVTDDA